MGFKYLRGESDELVVAHGKRVTANHAPEMCEGDHRVTRLETGNMGRRETGRNSP